MYLRLWNKYLWPVQAKTQKNIDNELSPTKMGRRQLRFHENRRVPNEMQCRIPACG
ncbi:predicted protein [Botrytis cinerea T4]|uniref:Uncharacterized protein n=1 Tax=Botryotinia fuckeliana (strain T4) TaxID=999810 RepID=G2YF87_BOTF4|nr:predicted protein [Botrytis cinerea T4]